MLETHVIAWWAAGSFAFAASLSTSIQIYLHYAYNPNKQMRRRTMRIIAMVIVYCFDSWFGLRYKNGELYYNTARDLYEAFVIYSFFQMLMEFLGGEDTTIVILQNHKPHAHMLPFCFLKQWEMGRVYFHKCRTGVLQYVPVKLFLTALTFILEYAEKYCEGNFSLKCGYPYIAFITNASQIWALYCLAMFYLPLKENLSDMRPVPKFLTIKLVVFLTFWQSVLIAAISFADKLQPTDTFTTDQISAGLQDFIVCIEMLFVSLAHIFAFPHLEFSKTRAKRSSTLRPFDEFFGVINVMDIAEDVKDVVSPTLLAGSLAGSEHHNKIAQMWDQAMVDSPRDSVYQETELRVSGTNSFHAPSERLAACSQRDIRSPPKEVGDDKTLPLLQHSVSVGWSISEQC